MTDDGSKKLGRGLSALLGAESADYASLDRVRLSKMVPIEQLQPGPFQPRRLFVEEELEALAESIRANGILQPILVRRRPQQPNIYEIVAGERRWRAAQRAQLHEVPVIIRDLGDREALELALVENLQRENLSPLEEAEGYRRLLDEFRNTQEDLAQHVGKSRSHIANMLRLLGLPEEVKALLDKGQLTSGHARVLVTAPDPVALAKRIVAQGLNVRQAERLAQQAKGPSKRAAKAKAPARDADTVALERDLSNLLGLKVSISFDGQGGALTIHYSSLEQLDDLLQRLTRAASTTTSESGEG
ncbi:MAG: ParB/RepB/Spo0J family partition protein [Pseudomonadota bacterium]